MEYVDSGTFVFTVTDSRGYSASQTITKEIIDYIPLTCNLSTNPDLVDGSTANVNITVKGKYFDGSFGAVDNSLTVEYRYKISNGTYPTDEDGNDVWTSLTGTPSNGEYTAQATITELDYTNSYTFQARAKDAVYTSGVSTVEQVVRIVPVFDWGENDFNFNVSVHSKGGFTYDIPVKHIDVDSILTSGKYYMGNSATNKPGNMNGWLEVQAYADNNYCYQRYISYLGKKYERWRNNGVWESWKDISIDFVTEQGTRDGWTYQKWNNGMAICFCNSNVSITNYGWGGGWSYAEGSAKTYPFAFITPPQCFISMHDYISLALPAIRASGTTTKTPVPAFARPSSWTESSINVSFFAIGKWK